MRDPAEIYTKRGTPILVVITRVGFGIYGIFVLIASHQQWFADTQIPFGWFGYLALLYLCAEQLYASFRAKGIDLTFAFPLLLSVYLLNLTSIALNAQERIPLINRVEHFAAFVLLTYVVWVFFHKYLPQNVWSDHPYYTAILVFSVVAAFGVVNEVVELFLDYVFKTKLIGLSRFDTPLDLLMNSLGSASFLGVGFLLNYIQTGKISIAKR